MTMDSGDTKWVVFIDSLAESDLDRTDFLSGSMQGYMEATPPRVTPRVMSSIYTGRDPAENGMMRSQMHGQQDQTRPEQPTIMERAMGDGRDVLSFHMPFSIPTQPEPGSASIGTAMGGQMQISPSEMQGALQVAGPQGDLVGDRRHDIVFDHFVDYATQIFATARSLAPEYDVVFIGFRLIDSYTHFQYQTGESGRGTERPNRYRDRLAEAIDIQIKQLLPRGDVLWFSDHGATEKTDSFLVNKWLSDNGYLSYTYDKTFIDKANEYGVMGGEDHPADQRVENQAVIGQPGIVLEEDESKAICADPFDSSITWLGDDDDEMFDLIDDLYELDYYRDVYHRSELFNEDGKYYDQTPHIVPDRAEGVFVSGNIHPDPIGMSWYRSGVHSKWGLYGSNTDVGRGTVTPEEMHDIIAEFLNVETGSVDLPSVVKDMTPVERQRLKEQL